MKPHEIELNEFFEFADIKHKDRVWDFGCGSGRMIVPLIAAGCKVYATDKDYGQAPQDKVDKVLLACVLHYNQFKYGILLTAIEQLKPGGKIVIIEPNPRNPFFYCLYIWRWIINSKSPRRWHNEKHMRTDKELVDLLQFAGFKNIKVKKYAWLPSKFRMLGFNKWLNRIPIINKMNAFNWIVGEI